MKTFYGVRTKFFDNGKCEVSRLILECKHKPDNINEEHTCFDLYEDWFDNKVEADRFLNDALAEGAKVV